MVLSGEPTLTPLIRRISMFFSFYAKTNDVFLSLFPCFCLLSCYQVKDYELYVIPRRMMLLYFHVTRRREMNFF